MRSDRRCNLSRGTRRTRAITFTAEHRGRVHVVRGCAVVVYVQPSCWRIVLSCAHAVWCWTDKLCLTPWGPSQEYRYCAVDPEGVRSYFISIV